MSLAVARLFATDDRTYHKPDQQALTSLLSFLVGSSVGRVGDKVGPKRRWWLMLATFIMALFTMAAALCAHFSHEQSVAECVCLISSCSATQLTSALLRFRTNASWQNAKGMAALGFASASLGLQVHPSRFSPALSFRLTDSPCAGHRGKTIELSVRDLSRFDDGLG